MNRPTIIYLFRDIGQVAITRFERRHRWIINHFLYITTALVIYYNSFVCVLVLKNIRLRWKESA